MLTLPLPAMRLEAFAGPSSWMTPKPRYAELLAAFAMIGQVEAGPPGATIAFQEAHLRRLLDGAAKSSAFWRGRLTPGARRLRDLPVLRRSDVRTQVEAEGCLPVPPDHGATVLNTTSGSTGQPVTFHVSAYNGLYNRFRNYYDVFAQGRDLAKPFTATRSVIADSRADRWPGLIGEMFRTGPFRSICTAGLTVEAVAQVIAAEPVGHLSIQPHILSGLLDLVEHRDLRLSDVGQVVTFAETVDDRLRERVRRLLGARVADRYACEEVGPIAFQCPRDDRHYHVATSNVVVETVDEAGAPAAPGTLGRVLVTGLHSHATPFVRYEVGDLAELRPSCPCGHRGPALANLLGRMRSLLRLPDGQRRFLRLVAGDWAAVPGVREFRVVQTAPLALEAELVTDHPLTASEEAEVLSVLRAKSHPDFKVSARRVERIDWGPSYKRIDVVCLVD